MSLVKLSDVANVIAGQSPKSENYNKEKEGLPFYQGKKDFGEKFLKPPSIWTREVTKIAKAGDLLFSVRAPVGAINLATEEVCIGRGLAAIRVKSNIDKNYLFYVLSSISKNLDVTSGAIFNSISKKQIESITFLLPPLAEQVCIIEMLDFTFDEIHKLKNISRKAVLIYSQLLNQIIIQFLRNKNFNWKNKYLDEISTNLDSNRKPITKSKRINGLTPYYGASGIVDYVQGYIFDDDLLLISEDGANLISRSYPIAFSISGRSWVNNHAHVLKFNSEDIQSWVEIYLNFKNIDDFISGMAQPKLNKAKLNQIPIPIPEESKLKEILETIVNAKELIKKVDINLIKKSELFDNLKSSILKKTLNINL
ncbi:Type I restriction-modification system [Prochlorococcus marinus str. MIT 9302]|uniref:Type I restriction-modification system n=1 Tax=Prochlorococcus marinus str. MIT 9302 TaxID=74545 RepID=A0A0A2A4F0_PROMR|nr:restriction endonuclease subunit S [Prochlorococcus marinus]KGF96757.1 Type I restriction-modification system [Prochlorococcus marinus str. MIT 9302]